MRFPYIGQVSSGSRYHLDVGHSSPTKVQRMVLSRTIDGAHSGKQRGNSQTMLFDPYPLIDWLIIIF